jgi:hypothetical protein
MTMLSRRYFLAAGPAFATALGSGLYVWSHGSEFLIGQILARRLPGVRLDSASVKALSRDVLEDRFHSFGRKIALQGGAIAARVVGVDALSRLELTAVQFLQLERVVVTLFILGSDYLSLNDPKSDVAKYQGIPDVCPNPFAEYD